MGNDYFSIRVRELREKNKLSMDQLAKNLNVTKSRINMWENNGTVPRMDILVKLSNYFNVSTDYLLGNDSTHNIAPNNNKLSSLQRNLGKLSESDLEKAEGMLKAVFSDIFNDEDEEDDI
ncbi:MAG: helix-turn-helix domain-containing protein [Lachnospiraceae bacterium]|nr:helix-turn-helix domain-containing protein [Lachnospiraceae bacterium]